MNPPNAVTPSQRQVRRSFTAADGRVVWYWQYLPADHDTAGSRYPLLVFFHGSGETGAADGSQLERVKLHGPPKLIAAGHDMCFDTPGGRECFIVVSPQNSRGWWAAEDTLGMLQHAIAGYRVDPRRVYVTGLSMGGAAAWNIATARDTGTTPAGWWASRLAAVVPVCGAAPSGAAGAGLCQGIVGSGLPVWAFHGDADPVVNPAWSQAWVDKINGSNHADNYSCAQAGNPPARLTLYPGGDHDSWTRTYDRAQEVEPGKNLYQWLLAQRRS